jgi:glucan phosphoethanolaminetransferase (alkaline phosphatase superfamily)
VVAAIVARAEDAPPKPPNIVLIAADTLRADHLSAYGYPHGTTPIGTVC